MPVTTIGNMIGQAFNPGATFATTPIASSCSWVPTHWVPTHVPNPLPAGFQSVMQTVYNSQQPWVLVGKRDDPETYFWGCQDHPEIQHTTRGYQGVYGDGSQKHQPACAGGNCPVCNRAMTPIPASKFKCSWWEHPVYQKFADARLRWHAEQYPESKVAPWAKLYKP